MKKIIGLGIAVAVIIALVTTGTFALFSDTETADDNTFTAGIIDLVMVPEAGQAVASLDGLQLEFKPCETGYLTITLTADEDSNPMHVWKHIKEIIDDDRGEGATPDAEQDWYDDPNNPASKNDIDRYIHFDMELNDDADFLLESLGWLLTDNPDDTAGFVPAPIDDYAYNGVTCKWIYLGILDYAGNYANSVTQMVIVESFHMDETVDNWAQGDVLTFDEEFYAIQVVGNPTPPGDELPGYTSGLAP